MSRRRNRINRTLLKLKKVSNVLQCLILIFFILFIFSMIINIPSNHQKNTDISKSNKPSIESTENTSSNAMESAETTSNNNENVISEENITTNQTQAPSTPRDIVINMAFTGDIMCHNTIYQDAYNANTLDYNFSYIFDNVKYYLQTADITVGNLETTFAGSAKGYSSYPRFNTPEALAHNLKNLGFDVLTTANNHCYDYNYSGVESTIQYLDDADISHTGTFTSPEAQNTILIKNVKGIQVAFLSFTYGTNGITVPSDKSYSVNIIDKELIKHQLELAKSQNPDLICVSMHWGVEYQTKPNAEQKDLADFLFQNGADLIIGNHPHVLQPMEKRTVTLDDGSTKDGFIVYSLGNFLADQGTIYTRDSAILNIKVIKSTDKKIRIASATYTPTYIYKDSSLKTNKFKLIDLKTVIESYNAGYTNGISSSLYNTFSNELNNINSILGEEIIK